MKNKYRILFIFLFITITAIITTSCTEPIISVDGSFSRGVDLSRIRRLAIVDFQVINGPGRASGLIYKTLHKEFLKLNYEILGRLKTMRILKNADIPTDYFKLTSNARRIGKLLGVDAIVSGSISAVNLRSGELPYNVTTSMTIMDTANGMIIWFGSGNCQDGILNACLHKIAKLSLKDFPAAPGK